MGERCGWCGTDPLYVAYHDDEWGVPEHDSRALYEKVVLDGFQAGLSWFTILRKRENFRAAFAGFDPDVVAGWGEPDVVRLLGDAGIVRHRGKIEAVINNAGRACELVDAEGSLGAFVWRFEPDASEYAAARGVSTSPASIALSRELKRRGWAFVGPTTAHAFLQAMGLINDHADGCVTRTAVSAARRNFVKPTRC
jgi:DNA-3-methyladenine glycosylase I